MNQLNSRLRQQSIHTLADYYFLISFIDHCCTKVNSQTLNSGHVYNYTHYQYSQLPAATVAAVGSPSAARALSPGDIL